MHFQLKKHAKNNGTSCLSAVFMGFGEFRKSNEAQNLGISNSIVLPGAFLRASAAEGGVLLIFAVKTPLCVGVLGMVIQVVRILYSHTGFYGNYDDPHKEF